MINTNPYNYNNLFNPRSGETNRGVKYFNPSHTPVSNIGDLDVLDSEWVRRAFLVPNKDFSGTTSPEMDKMNRFWSAASTKWHNTQMGGNIGINARPGFTPYADIPPGPILDTTQEPYASTIYTKVPMGRFYSEAIDDSSQTVYFTFGVPQYTSILRYLLTAFDINATSLVRTGEINIAGTIGRAVGFVGGVTALAAVFPAIPGLIIGAKALYKIFGGTRSKYYSLKETMHLYWTTVNYIANYIAVDKGIIPKAGIANVVAPDNATDQRVNTRWEFTDNDLAYMSQLLGSDVFRNGYFDVLAIASKPQRIAHAYQRKIYELESEGDTARFFGFIANEDNAKEKWLLTSKSRTQGLSVVNHLASTEPMFGVNMFTAIDAATSLLGYFKKVGFGTGDESVSISPSMVGDWDEKYGDQYDRMSDYFDAQFHDGWRFAVFKVDSTGSMSESFSNSTGESEIANQINALSSQAREAKFALQDGNTGIPVLDGLISSGMDFVKNALSAATFGAADFLWGMGVGFADIPKHWISSSASMPGADYKMSLVSPYGNVYSQMQNQIIPLSMLLAGALPRATGKQSYGSPFLCQVYDRGRVQIECGMITSLSITRGTTNLAFSKEAAPMGINVSFRVEDMSTVMAVPIATGNLFSKTVGLATGGVFGTELDEDNALTDYMAVLAGQSLYQQIYPWQRFKFSWARNVVGGMNQLTSSAYWASLVGDTLHMNYWPQSLFGNSSNILR